MAIFPDDIREIKNMDIPKQVDIIYEYIKYLKEQIEFWAGNRSKETTGISDSIETLASGITTVATAIGNLSEEALKKSEQTLTETEKSTVQQNLGLQNTVRRLGYLTGSDYNMNDFTSLATMGVYWVAPDVQNSPVTWGVLLSFVNDWGIQIAIELATNDLTLYVRRRYWSGSAYTWGSWKSLTPS